jgi:hypothetical protein
MILLVQKDPLVIQPKVLRVLKGILSQAKKDHKETLVGKDLRDLLVTPPQKV